MLFIPFLLEVTLLQLLNLHYGLNDANVVPVMSVTLLRVPESLTGKIHGFPLASSPVNVVKIGSDLTAALVTTNNVL